LKNGVGGYDDPKEGGKSLRMWRTYFQNTQIFGIDIHNKTCPDERRIKIFKGPQGGAIFLVSLAREIGHIDIVIDDDNHINDHILHNFKVLFPRISFQCCVIEDVQTSYQPEDYGGISNDLNQSKTTMGFLHLVDGLNYVEYNIKEHQSKKLIRIFLL
jgi:hypothetical protein